MREMRMDVRKMVTVAAVACAAAQACAGTDGAWTTGGTGFYTWADANNWQGQVAEGQDAVADFRGVNVDNQSVVLGGARTIGHLLCGDTATGNNEQWKFISGSLNFSVSSGMSTVEVSNVSEGAYFYTNMTVTGTALRKTGDSYLIFKDVPTLAIDVAEGTVQFSPDAYNLAMTNSISGAGNVSFGRTSAGRCRYLSTYGGVLSYTGKTIIEWASGGTSYYNGTLWLEKEDVLPHASVVELRSGNLFSRYNRTLGQTVGGLVGNPGTFITTIESTGNQKWTINVAEGEYYDFAGTIGKTTASETKNTMTVTKKGLGTQVFSGLNTFVGDLIVSNGTLLVNNPSGSGTGNGNLVIVAPGATLGGTGFVFSTQATLKTGSVLAPGGTNSAGTLTVSNLVMESAGILKWKCDATRRDLVNVLGNVTLPSVATVSVSRVTGDDYPGLSVLMTVGGANNGATDLSSWAVLLDGLPANGSCGYDAQNKCVVLTLNDYLPVNGTWLTSGGDGATVYHWTNSANWVGGLIPGRADALAFFNAVDISGMRVSLSGEERTVGQLLFGDTVAGPDDAWTLEDGTLKFNVSVGMPTVNVEAVQGGVTFLNSLAVSGNFRKTGSQTLKLKGFPAALIEVAEGDIEFCPDSVNEEMAAVSVSGPGNVRFGNLDTAGRCRILAGYAGSLSYTGRTVICWQTSDVDGRYYYGSLWLEKDNVMPRLSVLELLAGNLFTTRNSSSLGQTVGGLIGNPGTFISTDGNTSSLQKWTLDVAEGACYDFAGSIGRTRSSYTRDGIAVTKAGGGKQIFSGSNTFTGNLIVNGGALLINNTDGSGTGISNLVTVASGATLGGTGTSLSTNVLFAANARLSPGSANAAGTLAFGGAVTLGEGLVYVANYTAAAAPSVTVAGTLTLPEALTVALTPLAENAGLPKVITLFSAGALAGATDLSGWQVTGEGGERYDLTLGPASVTAALPPSGTVIMVQ